MRLQDTVLFLQVLDDLELLAVHPARQHDEQKPDGEGFDHAPSLTVRWLSAVVTARQSFRIVRGRPQGHRGGIRAHRNQRCLKNSANGPPILPAPIEILLGQMFLFRILQTPEYVVILSEVIQELRIIPLDRRPHLPRGIRQWVGDSRGRWEGRTLVVETTNLHESLSIAGFPAGNVRASRSPDRNGLSAVELRVVPVQPYMPTWPDATTLPDLVAGPPSFRLAALVTGRPTHRLVSVVLRRSPRRRP